MNTVNSRALALALALGLAFASTATAQSPTAGITGEGKQGDTVVIRNADTGFTREIKVRKNGRYQLRNLPTGTFVVITKHADGTTEIPKQVTLKVGTTARIL